jgi:Gnt-I system high-affinity gluconate transporter
MEIYILFTSIALLLSLITFLKLNPFLALLLTSISTGLMQGMKPAQLLLSIQNGIGSTMGSLAAVIGLGVILGAILSETGAAQVISSRLLALFGKKHANIALLCTGFVLGIAMFYNAGFVILAPLVFSVAANSGQAILPLAISMAAPLSVTHGFLPPHPAATAIANIFKADLGKTLILGALIALPIATIIAVFFSKTLKNIEVTPPLGLSQQIIIPQEHLPSFTKSLFVALVPVILMGTSTLFELNLPAENQWRVWAKFFGDPSISLLLAVLIGLLFFTKNNVSFLTKRNKQKHLLSIENLLEKCNQSVGAAAMLLLIIAAGGAFKQVLVDAKIAESLGNSLKNLPISPLILGWSIATVLRIAVGSATVAGMTAASIAFPIIQNNPCSPELMTIAIGAGSLMCSHVNDTGFWMFKEWFGLSLKDTFLSWTLMETLVGIMGLIGVLLLDCWI